MDIGPQSDIALHLELGEIDDGFVEFVLQWSVISNWIPLEQERPYCVPDIIAGKRLPIDTRQPPPTMLRLQIRHEALLLRLPQRNDLEAQNDLLRVQALNQTSRRLDLGGGQGAQRVGGNLLGHVDLGRGLLVGDGFRRHCVLLQKDGRMYGVDIRPLVSEIAAQLKASLLL